MQNGRWTCQNVANTIQNGRWTCPHVGNPMQNGRWTCQNVANTIQNGRWTCPHVENPMQNGRWTCPDVANTMQNDKFKFQTVANTGKWYQPRNPKKIPNLIKKKFQKLFHTLFPAINFPYFPMIFPLKPSIYRVQSSHVWSGEAPGAARGTGPLWHFGLGKATGLGGLRLQRGAAAGGVSGEPGKCPGRGASGQCEG